MYSEYRIAFDRAGEWSFNNDSARNVMISAVDNTDHTDHQKGYDLIFDERQFSVLMEAWSHKKKRFVLILVKQIQVLFEFAL